MNPTYDKPLNEVTSEKLKQLVGEKYDKVAACPLDKHNFPIGRSFALAVGYPKKELDKLPDSLVDSFAGVNYPPSFQEMKQDDVVLDIGCGAGLDLYFSSKKVGNGGVVFGIDISKEMIKKARSNVQKVGLVNIKVKLAHSDRIPLDGESVDVVTSNGIYNLSPDKKAVLKEVYRVLRSNGMICFSEIILKQELEQEIRKSVKDWFRCIGGALTLEKFVSLMKEIGFKDVEVLSTCRNARCGHEFAIVADIKARR